MKFSHKWPVARLDDVVADMQPGFAQAPGEGVSGTGQIRTHNVTPDGELSLAELKYVSPSEKEAEKYLLKKGDIVFNNTNSEEWVGKTALFDIDEPLLFSNHMTRIRVNTKLVLPEFMARYLHFLWKVGFSKTRAKRWVSQAAVDQRELSTYRVPLPSLPEQQRIVEILRQADALRRQRREILDQAKQLPDALFLEMFGDPRSHAQRWKKVSLSKLVEVRSSLKTPTPEEYGPWPCIGPDSIETGTGRIISMPTVQDVLPESGKYQFEAGDVLYSKIRPNLAKVALAEVAGFCSADMYALVCGPDIRPTFLQYLLLSGAFTQFALGYSGRAQMPKLNRDQLFAYRAVVPPIDLQSKFETIVSGLRGISDQAELSIRETDLLVATISFEAFSGQLTASWLEVHHAELEKWHRDHAEQLPKKPTRISFKEIAPPERATPSRPARHWVMDQLSTVQQRVHLALAEWKGTLIPAEDLGRFLEEWPIAGLEDAHDQVLRALNQLAGLGLIARVSIPNQMGEYVSGYRVLREDELSKFDDERRLGAPA